MAKRSNNNGQIIAIYDKDVDILSIGKDGEVRASIDLGEIILDVGTRNSIIGVEILNVSKNFGIPKKSFSNIKNRKFEAHYHKNHILVVAGVTLEDRELDIPIPLRMGRSALATA